MVGSKVADVRRRRWSWRWNEVMLALVMPLFVGPATVASIGADRAVGSAGRVPADVSVVMVVIDEAPLWPLLGSDGRINAARWPGFASLASVSTWYRDTKTTAQWTYFAVPSILDGRYPTFRAKPIFADHPRNVFTALEGHLRMEVRETMTHLCPTRLCAPTWRPPVDDLKGYVTVFESAVEQAAVSTLPTFHFVHTVFPHRPWKMAPDMRMSPTDVRDTRSGRLVDRKRDSYQSHLRQYLAADAAIGSMVERLRSSPNWDRTMLVVTADHGLTFAPGESVRDRINPANPGSMEDVFSVPLFIKYPGQRTSAVADCTVSSVDILPTILGTVAVGTSWTLDGVDLGSSCPDRATRRVRWPKGFADMPTRFDAVLDRVKYYDAWVPADGDADGIYRVGRSGALVGTSVPRDAPVNPAVTWTLDAPEAYQRVGLGRFSQVPVRATGRFRAVRALSENEEGLVVIDGTVVGVVAEMSGAVARGEEQFFSSSILTRMLRPGRHAVELWLADWGAGAVRLSRVGTPSG